MDNENLNNQKILGYGNNRKQTEKVRVLMSKPLKDRELQGFSLPSKAVLKGNQKVQNNIGMVIFDLWGYGGFKKTKNTNLSKHHGNLTQHSAQPKVPVCVPKSNKK